MFAKVIQISEDKITNEKCYYVHYLDFEKRMDRWVENKHIIKNHGNGNKLKDFSSVMEIKLFNFEIYLIFKE